MGARVEFPDLIFEPKEHTYRVGKIEYPSVTTILKAEGFMPWLNQVDPWTLAEAAERGTRVHEMCARLAKQPQRVSRKALDLMDVLEEKQELGYVSAFMKWLDESRFQIDPKTIERKFYSKQGGYAGRIDFGGVMPVGRERNLYEAIVDIKTGGFEPAARLQTAAYLYGGGFPEGAERGAFRIILKLQRDGEYRSVVLPRDEGPVDYRTFTSAVECYTFKRRYNLIGQAA